MILQKLTCVPVKILTRILLIISVLTGCHSTKQFIQPEQPFVFPCPASSVTKKLPLKPERLIPLVSIASVGDIMLGNHTIYYIEKYGVDYPFDSTRSILAGTYVTFGNLESPFTKTGRQFDKRFTFKTPPEYAISLVNAGFDVVTLANNHILDYGIEGLKNTINILDSIGLGYCGAGLTQEQAQRPAILERNGCRIAFLGYTMTFPEEFWAMDSTGGTNYPYKMSSSIQHIDSLADFTIVTFHWGAESRNYPKEYQKVFAHRAIDYGADLVLGHHPHVLQGLEIYKNRLIAYSLGNFSFSSYSRKATESIILKAYLSDNGLLFAKIIPISVNNIKVAFQPQILHGAAADTVISHLRKYSKPLNSTNIIDNNGYIWGERYIPADSLDNKQMNQGCPAETN